MSPLATAYPYGLRDIEIKPITTVATETLGTLLDVPAARVFSFTDSEEFTELRGDDHVVTSRGKGATCTWELESGGYGADVAKTIVGGTLTDSGTTPNQKRVMDKKWSDARPWFRVEGQIISDNGGDVHGLVYRCRCTSDVKREFKDGEWYLFNVSGIGLPSLEAANVDKLYTITYNETAAVIT